VRVNSVIEVTAMKKNVWLGVLMALLLVLVYSDITVLSASDGWCAWWRTHVKVCSVDVDLAASKGGAVCSTDLDCAAWEVRTDTPHADRVFGAPVPSTVSR
jgi:hypothetical protein